MTIRCEIVSQDRTVFQGDVDIVVLPGAAGEMGILPHHAPVLAILKVWGDQDPSRRQGGIVCRGRRNG